MKQKLTESQLRDKIYTMVLEQLEEGPQQREYVSDYSEPAQELLNWAEKCDILKDTLREHAEQLENIVDEANQVISSIIGPQYSKKSWTSGDEVYIDVALQEKDIASIKNYLLRNQNAFSDQFGEMGDYEGMTMEEVTNDLHDMLWFLSEVVLHEKAEEITNEQSRNGFSVSIDAYYRDNSITVTINCPINFDTLENIGQIADV